MAGSASRIERSENRQNNETKTWDMQVTQDSKTTTRQNSKRLRKQNKKQIRERRKEQMPQVSALNLCGNT
jgi:hypothetical protein